EGTGLSILPAGAFPNYLGDSFAKIPVDGLPPRLVGVAQRRRGLPGAPVRAVLEILSEIVFDPARVPPGVRPVAPGGSVHSPLIPPAGPFGPRPTGVTRLGTPAPGLVAPVPPSAEVIESVPARLAGPRAGGDA
ncbi:MAG: hypothetical protein JWM85_1824, partial [Acidimicrobiaceae bacterium]|nr:hypothetical protein [Acidimicrobiaceae bacterium]